MSPTSTCRVRADPFIVKGEGLWAEHHCVAPMEQWSVGNEAYASALDDPDDALGRAYGDPTPIAFDLEWYATGDAVAARTERSGGSSSATSRTAWCTAPSRSGGEPSIELAEVPAHRWHRWAAATAGSRPAGAGRGRSPTRACARPSRSPTAPSATWCSARGAGPDEPQHVVLRACTARTRTSLAASVRGGVEGGALLGRGEVAERQRLVGDPRGRRARPCRGARRRRRPGSASARRARPAGSRSPPRRPTSARCRGTSR